MSPKLFEAVWLREQLLHPPVTPMWVAGGVDRERWYGHRFEPGQVIECAIRDGEGHAQGTIILEVAAALSTDGQGHWVTAKFVGASDSHMRKVRAKSWQQNALTTFVKSHHTTAK